MGRAKSPIQSAFSTIQGLRIRECKDVQGVRMSPTTPSSFNPFNARATLETPLGTKTIYRLDALKSIADIDRLPYSIKVLLESCLRNVDGRAVTEADVKAIAEYTAENPANFEIPFMPGRVVLQDFTGVPAVVDLAAMRAAMKRMGGNPNKVNP